jgi:UDP-2,4-diacetamido-2,4,6-trideoxy-beta-L-altropyranose hydrolase
MNLFFRTDASLTMGTGHVMRCIALAQAAQDAGGRDAFALAESTAGIRAKLAEESCDVLPISAEAGSERDWGQCISLAREQRADWIVVDGYQFGDDYQRALKAAGFKVLFLDDYGHAAHYSADLVLNQNAQAKESLYAVREPYIRLLLGTEYCLLRREFSSWRGWKREIAPVGSKVLVTMGGSDPDNVTEVVIAALQHLPHLEATVVVGGSNPHFDSLQRLASQGGQRFRLLRSVDNMPELMAWADVAVSGAGSTCWEMCLLQLPMLLIDLADNQKPIAGALDAMGAAIHLGASGNVSAGEVAERVRNLLAAGTDRASLSKRCGQLVDGRGAERVLGELSRGLKSGSR